MYDSLRILLELLALIESSLASWAVLSYQSLHDRGSTGWFVEPVSISHVQYLAAPNVGMNSYTSLCAVYTSSIWTFSKLLSSLSDVSRERLCE